jgi:hypothetical protein
MNSQAESMRSVRVDSAADAVVVLLHLQVTHSSTSTSPHALTQDVEGDERIHTLDPISHASSHHHKIETHNLDVSS